MSTHKYSNSDEKAQGKTRSPKLQRLDQWFPAKKYLSVLCAANCPLKHNERRLYSYLVFRHRHGQTATQQKAVRALTIGKKTAARIIEKLLLLGLVERSGRQLKALEPKEKCWFAWKQTGDAWCFQLATYREYRREEGAPISEVANGIWSLMYSLAKGGKPGDPLLLSNQTNTGIAKLLGCSARQVRRTLSWLKEQGLIQCCGQSYILRAPTEKQLCWWQPRPDRKTGPRETEKYLVVQIRGEGLTIKAINREIEKWSHVMIEARYTQKQIADYWTEDVIRRISHKTEDTMFALLIQSDLFGSTWREVEAQHATTGKAINSLALLRHCTPKILAEAQREAEVA